MAETVGDRIVRRLREWRVPRVYGYPGGGFNGILAGLQRAGEDPRFVQVRHEDMAAFRACAHAKWTGAPGVCMATSGPVAIHLLNGPYDAKLDHQPVVAIVGQGVPPAALTSRPVSASTGAVRRRRGRVRARRRG